MEKFKPTREISRILEASESKGVITVQHLLPGTKYIRYYLLLQARSEAASGFSEVLLPFPPAAGLSTTAQEEANRSRGDPGVAGSPVRPQEPLAPKSRESPHDPCRV